MRRNVRYADVQEMFAKKRQAPGTPAHPFHDWDMLVGVAVIIFLVGVCTGILIQ